MLISKWVGWVRDVVRLVRSVPDEELRQQTLALHEELVRLRKHRKAQEKEREEAGLREIRMIVEELKVFERNLQAAEDATTEYVETVAEEATRQFEADLNMQAEILIKRAEQFQSLPSESTGDESLPHNSEDSRLAGSGLVSREPSASGGA